VAALVATSVVEKWSVNSLVELLSDDQRLEFMRHTTERNFARNEVVFHEGDPADSMHIVEKGLFVARSSSTLGHVLIVNVFRPGSVFGELALLRTEPVRSATVAALRPGRTRLLRRVELERLRSGPTGRQLDQFLLTALAEQNLALTAQLIELLFTSTSKRIQRQLLRLHELGIVDDGRDGWMRLSQDELAMLTATTRATVNRVLRDLERRRIVDLGRGRSRIIDVAQLARLSR
jgi:CRP/FNR family transcriptional regulator, cyclic AMP receptor protein